MLNVAVTGMNARPDNPGPGLSVARCIRESTDFSGRLLGLGYDALDPGLYLREICDAGYLLPYPSTGEDALFERLSYIHEQENIDVLIPCLDAELPSMVRLQAKLREIGIHMWLPTAEQLRLRNKDRLDKLAEHAEIRCPETILLTRSDFFQDCDQHDWEYPFLVKGLFYDAEIVHDATQARAAFHRIASSWGYPVLAQRLVKGEEYNLTALGDGQGKMLGPVMMKKTGLTDKGKAWAGITIDDRHLYDASARLVRATSWRGPLEVEVIKDEDGAYHLVEINPRFPAWIYLATGVGINLPRALIELALGRPAPDFQEAPAGVLFSRYAAETVLPLIDFESVVVDGVRK